MTIQQLKICWPDSKNDEAYTVKILCSTYWDDNEVFVCANSPVGKPILDIEPLFQNRLLRQLK